MAANPNESQRMTEAEYLAFERANPIRHEYLAGEVFAMSGASRAHNLISGNLVVALKTQLRGRDCELYAADMRVKIAPLHRCTYPDLSIVCDALRFADEALDTLLNPTLIIEILSPSTEAYDRGREFHAYQHIDSLREYLLVVQDGPHIERYLRREGGIWEYTSADGLHARLALDSVGCTLVLADVYEQVNFEAAHDSESE